MDTSNDTGKPLKAWQRWLRSRKSQAIAPQSDGIYRTPGEGVGVSAASSEGMHPLVPQNFLQKAIIDSPSAEIIETKAEELPVTAISEPVATEAPPESPAPYKPNKGPLWADGSKPAVIYALPSNPHLILVEFADGGHGKIRVNSEYRRRFGVGKRVWVLPRDKAMYELAGTYNYYGNRVA